MQDTYLNYTVLIVMMFRSAHLESKQW